MHGAGVSFYFHIARRDNVIRQQLGFHFAGNSGIPGIAFQRRRLARRFVLHRQFVVNLRDAFDRFCHAQRLTFLFSTGDVAAEGDHFVFRFHRNIAGVNILMVDQRRLYPRGNGAVVHKIADFINRIVYRLSRIAGS
ncbi:hypothetical protein SB00610_03361 [Klebsiella quasipneumoniae subsp. similipneumoniae]|nr:hypothetical protein SB00610_03361 [Klebsiella quasipneumoniae subsp. similipneumoniae]